MFGWAVFNTVFNIWLSVWTAATIDPDRTHGDDYYITYYVVFGVCYGITAFLRALIQAFSNPKMSTTIHEAMNTNLLFSSLNEFFDRVPLGRILNRLSKDLNSVDSTIPAYFSNLMVFLFFMITNIFVILYCSTIWVFFPILAYLLGCYFLKNYYMKPNRELVRL
jgi:ABC-type multidrug transport system fused ATPase/permease subunit